MIFSQIDKIFIADFNIDSILARKQSWNENRPMFNTNQPRKRHGLFLITNCPAKYTLSSGEVIIANIGDIMLLPKGSLYQTEFIAPPFKESNPIVINFRMTDLKGEEIKLPETVCKIPCDGDLFPLFDKAANCYKKSNYLKLKATLYEIFSRLFPIHQQDECLISYINNNITKNFSVAELAKKCLMSETAYRNRFKEITGQSPLHYINRLKILKSCEMLLNSDMKPKEISDFLDFYSPQYFYRVFRQYMGVSPLQFREQNQLI